MYFGATRIRRAKGLPAPAGHPSATSWVSSATKIRRAKGPDTSQPRATPWVSSADRISPEGADTTFDLWSTGGGKSKGDIPKWMKN